MTHPGSPSSAVQRDIRLLLSVLESFENGLGSYGGDIGDFDTVTTRAFDGNESLEAVSGDGTWVGISDTDVTVNSGDIFSFRFYDEANTRSRVETLFFTQDEVGASSMSGYSVRYDALGGEAYFSRWSGGSKNTITQINISAPTGEWLEARIHTGEFRNIVHLLDSNENEVDVLTAMPPGNYSSGGVGSIAYDAGGGQTDYLTVGKDWLLDAPAPRTNITSNANNLYDGLDIIDMDGDGNIDIVTVYKTAVEWWEQGSTPSDWTQHQIDSGLNEMEGVNAADIDGDGNVEVVAMDQGADDLIIYSQDSGDPTGSWSSTVLDGSAGHIQSAVIADVDGDGNTDIIYAYEGGSSGSGGVFWQKYSGGNVLTGGNWTKYTANQIDGAWWLAESRLDLSNDGNRDDVVFGVRENANGGATAEVGWLEVPATATNTWTKNTIEQPSGYVPLQVETGNLFGNGHSKDVVAGAYDSGSGIYLYDYSNNWSRTTLNSSGRWYSVYPDDFTANTRDDIIAVSYDNAMYIYEYSGGSWNEHLVDAQAKSDDRKKAHDIDGDGTLELFAQNSHGLDWWDVTGVV